MEAVFNVKNPPKRKIPKMRVPRTHYWVMQFPKDLESGKIGLPYNSFFDSFLEDCNKRLFKYWKECWWHEVETDFSIQTFCLN